MLSSLKKIRLKLPQKENVQKAAEATGDFIGIKIADRL